MLSTKKKEMKRSEPLESFFFPSLYLNQQYLYSPLSTLYNFTTARTALLLLVIPVKYYY